MVLPWVFYQEIIEDEDMGDLEYLEAKIIAGDVFQVSGNINALNDVISYTPASGKRAILLEAKITFNTITTAVSSRGSTTASSNNQVIADLLINSVVKSKTAIGTSASSASFGTGGGQGGSGSGFGINPNGIFNIKTLSLVGDAIKKIEIKNVLDSGSAFAEMSGYLV